MVLPSQVTGEPCDAETVKHGLEGGGWKSTSKGIGYKLSKPKFCQGLDYRT